MPIPTSTIHSLKVTPFPAPAKFGVIAEGIDLNTITEEQFKELELLIYTERVVVLKGQKDLWPKTQQALGIRFDPKTPAELGHMEDVRAVTTIFGKGTTTKKPTMPEAWLVNLNGSGEFPAGYQGIDHPFTLKGLGHVGFHRDCLSDEDLEKGETRFQRWHIDAPFFKNWPARVTQIYAHKMPQGEPVNVRWDDGSNLVTKSAPGRTAFFDCVALYKSLTPEQKAWVDNSLVEYAPSPYQWLTGAKAMGNGLAMFTEGKEHGLEGLSDADPRFAQTIPMVWLNPVTGEKALQVHAIIAYKIHYKDSPTAEVKVIDDLLTVRTMLDDLQRPFVTPENVMFAPTEEGDMLFFYNRGVRHSAVEFPASRGPRLLQQLQLVGSDAPFAPAPIEGLPYALAAAA
ncbi:Clavaminate synthase-like protein [Meredithblackwellia eburnea MCA 4105]